MSAFNFFSAPSEGTAHEEFLTLHESDGLKIERIASHGQASPDGFWYDQSSDEWVMLVQGDAMLEFEDGRCLSLRVGDCQFLAKNVRHRVAHASMDALWLAVHSGAGPS